MSRDAIAIAGSFAVIAGLVALGLLGLPRKAPPPAPAAPDAAGPRPAMDAARAPVTPPPAAPLAPDATPPGRSSVTITQIMIAYKAPHGVPTRRTKAEAYDIAKALVAKIVAGTKMETLLALSDDLGPDGKPFNDGSYSLANDSPARPALLRAAFSTPVGHVAPEPIDSGFGWHVIRRDQ